MTPEGNPIPEMPDPSCGTEEAPFQAVLVFSDPVDWYRDLQLITDVVMSGQLCCIQLPLRRHDFSLNAVPVVHIHHFVTYCFVNVLYHIV